MKTKLSLIIAGLNLITTLPLIILVHLQTCGYNFKALPISLALFIPITMFASGLCAFMAGHIAGSKQHYNAAIKILLTAKTIQARVNTKTGKTYIALTTRGIDSDTALTENEVLQMASDVVDENLKKVLNPKVVLESSRRDTSI